MMTRRYLTMATTGDKPKKSEQFRLFVRQMLDFIFGFKNKKGEVLDYQLEHADGVSFSTQEFLSLIHISEPTRPY